MAVPLTSVDPSMPLVIDTRIDLCEAPLAITCLHAGRVTGRAILPSRFSVHRLEIRNTFRVKYMVLFSYGREITPAVYVMDLCIKQRPIHPSFGWVKPVVDVYKYWWMGK